MEEVFYRLDPKHLSKLAKIIPQKISGFSVMPKNPSQSYQNKLFKQFMKEKNLTYIFKYISNGNFHDILVKDMQIYESIVYNTKDDFFREIQGKNLETPFSFYIFLIEQNDEALITKFFDDITGIIDFRDRAFLYIEKKNNNKNIDNSTDINLSEYNEATSSIKEYQEKIVEVEKINNILLKENNKLKKKIEKNNNDKIREINNLEKKHQNEKEIENKKYEGILNGISLKTKSTEKRINNLEIKIADQNKMIVNKEEKINELKNKNKEITRIMETKLVEKNKLINILLIGTPGKISVRQDYNFVYVDPSTSIEIIESIITEKKISELWVTNFQVIPRKKKKIIQNFKNKLKTLELNDFTMLMSGGS